MLKPLWKPRVFLGKYLQASEGSHTWIRGVNPILSDRSFQIGWKASVSCHLWVFKGLKSWLWLKHARTVRIVLRLLQHCLSCMLWVIVKLKGEPSLQPQVPTVNTGVGLIQGLLCIWLHSFFRSFNLPSLFLLPEHQTLLFYNSCWHPRNTMSWCHQVMTSWH